MKQTHTQKRDKHEFMRVIPRDEFMKTHARYQRMTIQQLEQRIDVLRSQETNIRQRWSDWQQARLDRARPVYEAWLAHKDHVTFKREIARRWNKFPLFEKYDPAIETAHLWLRFFNAVWDYQSKCLCSELQPITDELRRCDIELKNRAYFAKKQQAAKIATLGKVA